jgi:Fic family protein
MTLRRFAEAPDSIPLQATWYLADLGQALGRQELFTRQAPQKLKVLRDRALAESAVSSNRIEGVEVEQDQVATLVFGHRKPRNRDEEELRGYRKSLNLIHAQASQLPVSEDTVLRLHKLSRGEVWDAGHYKDQPVDIIETDALGNSRVRFRSVDPIRTPQFLREALAFWDRGLIEKPVPPLVLLGALNLDFLCIHPFRDGNGRVSRLLLLLSLYHLGYEVGRYISIERIIEENKPRYYETLQQSSQGWHEEKHDPWPYVNFLLFVLNAAYKEFEGRLGEIRDERGAKTGLVEAYVESREGHFTLGEVEQACPGVSRDMVRRVLDNLRKAGRIRCVTRGRSARWIRIA